jgi:hypothetical protein
MTNREPTADQWEAARKMAAQPKLQDSFAVGNRVTAFSATPPPPTPAEVQERRVAAASEAWRSVRERTAGWPQQLAAAEVAKVADQFGGEPGAESVSESLAARVSLVPTPGIAEDADPVSRALVESLAARRG